jgi:putative NIF3 family GTP cyclohydrolase 1 type 2
MVKSIAVGAGSGSKLLNNANVDLVLTGEFAHHEILHETHRGVHVILTDHSNNERCYFEHFKKSFSELLNKYNEKVEIFISKEDRDPLSVI